MKASLEEAARVTNRSVARLLDEIVAEHLDAGQPSEAEMDKQHRLHAKAARFAGRFSGTNPARGERAKVLVRLRLAERRNRER